MTKFAHSIEEKPEGEWEPLQHHLLAVGAMAGRFAETFGCAGIAVAMGLLHDIGKCAQAYQDYIRRPRDAGGAKGPDHSTAGAKEAVATYGKGMGRLMAFGIAGHHAGLMDGSGHESGNLDDRLAKPIEDYRDWRDHIGALPTMTALTEGRRSPERNAIEPGFTISFLVRMLFSCLVDADFIATEAFYAQSRGEPAPERGGELTQKHRETVRAHMARHRRDDTPVNRLRSEILDHAQAKAALPPGLFTLTVPTGGGKTLTSLSFAMEHAFAHDLRRIIYIIPFAEAWIETPTSSRKRHASPSRLPRGGVDRNLSMEPLLGPVDRRLPRGGVDRNTVASAAPTSAPVASRAEAWIETVRDYWRDRGHAVASRAEAWIETRAI